MEEIKGVISKATQRLVENVTEFGTLFPYVSDGHAYTLRENDNWTAGFWPGLLWLIDSNGAPKTARTLACELLNSFEARLEAQTHINHDLGFLFTLSAKAQWQMTQDESAKALALRAADDLVQRYRQPGQYIQAWGPVGDAEKGGQIIADTMMNLPLLFWASEQTADSRYHEAAYQHAQRSRQYLIREDGSSFHTYFFNQETGAPIAGRTHQGYSDDSCWARGQAWLIYGFALAAQWCDEPQFLEAARETAVYFLSKSPADQIPLWDLHLPDHEVPYRDSSAAAIAACGLLRIAELSGNSEMRAAGEALTAALITHCWETGPNAQGLIKQGALHVPKGWIPDGYLIFGDYFFLEALLTLEGKNPDFWGPTKQENGDGS